MAPNGTAVTGLLRQAVYYHLDNASYDNALFFSERLAAHDPKSSESSFLLALSHFRLGDYRSACEVGKPIGYRGLHLGCVYVYAQSCLALERFREGIVALEKSRGLWVSKNNLGRHTASTRTLHPDVASVSCLLGKLYRAIEDKKKAIACFEDALRANPFMWDAFTSLCDIGVGVRVPNVFRVSDALLRNFDHEPSETSSEQKEGGLLFSPLEPVSKKASARAGMRDVSDPFDQQRPTAFQDVSSFSNIVAADAEPNYFMSKIEASRLRLAATSNGHSLTSDGTETPPGLTASGDAGPSRGAAAQQEPPHAPSRKRGVQHSVESSFMDVPTKTSYQLGPRRRAKPLDGEHSAADQAASSLLRPSTLSAAERKRTASGHPVAPRQPQSLLDEPGAPRRSTRLNMFRPSASKTNSGAATIGAAATRELKKARPPISRIMRPGSSGSTVGRVVSGNRKPLEENSMDVEQAEAPPLHRVREPPMPPAPPKAPEQDSARTEEALKWVLDLLKKLGFGYLSLSQFQCHEALQIFGSLPRSHSDTPWVQAQMGRAQCRGCRRRWAGASVRAGGPMPRPRKHFRRVRVLAPTPARGTWKFTRPSCGTSKERRDLSFLAHEAGGLGLALARGLVRPRQRLVPSRRTTSRRCCASNGRRSWTTSSPTPTRCRGHEHVLNEEYEKALTAYRHAIAADRRHYNAYYGIGKGVREARKLRQGVHTHYQAASVIQPRRMPS